jgi:hypothetical protein
MKSKIILALLSVVATATATKVINVPCFFGCNNITVNPLPPTTPSAPSGDGKIQKGTMEKDDSAYGVRIKIVPPTKQKSI